MGGDLFPSLAYKKSPRPPFSKGEGLSCDCMIYFLLGKDNTSKETKIAELRKKYLPSPEAQKFDYEVLHANKLNPQILKKALLSLPAMAGKRLILIRDSHTLNPHNKKLIMEFVSSNFAETMTVLILESSELGANDSFVKKIKPFTKAPIMTGAPEKKANVFDMTRAMTGRRKTEALKILSELFSDGVHPLQIMGGLVWFWGNKAKKITPSFEQGLAALQEADLNIKRSRLKPEYAIEVLVVKLCGILAL